MCWSINAPDEHAHLWLDFLWTQRDESKATIASLVSTWAELQLSELRRKGSTNRAEDRYFSGGKNARRVRFFWTHSWTPCAPPRRARKLLWRIHTLWDAMAWCERGVQTLLAIAGAFAAFSLMTIAIGTDYWLYSRAYICNATNMSTDETQMQTKKVKGDLTHSGLWRICCIEGKIKSNKLV